MVKKQQLLLVEEKTLTTCISVHCTIVCWFTDMVSQYLILHKLIFSVYRIVDLSNIKFSGLGGFGGGKWLEGCNRISDIFLECNERCSFTEWCSMYRGIIFIHLIIPLGPCLCVFTFVNTDQYFILHTEVYLNKISYYN